MLTQLVETAAPRYGLPPSLPVRGGELGTKRDTTYPIRRPPPDHCALAQGRKVVSEHESMGTHGLPCLCVVPHKNDGDEPGFVWLGEYVAALKLTHRAIRAALQAIHILQVAPCLIALAPPAS